MRYERLWERLLDFLNGWCQAREVEPGHIEVEIADARGQTHVVEILMTRDEWDAMVTVPWGDFEAAAQEVRRVLLTRSFHERFLVYSDYQLVPSAASSLATDPPKARRRDARPSPKDSGHTSGSWSPDD